LLKYPLAQAVQLVLETSHVRQFEEHDVQVLFIETVPVGHAVIQVLPYKRGNDYEQLVQLEFEDPLQDEHVESQVSQF
jgi:hypothetical protein